MTKIDFTKRIVTPSHVLFRSLAGEAVLLDLEQETYFGLNDVGTRMWQHLTTAVSIADAYAALRAEYAAEPQVLRQDLEALVSELIGQGLVRVVDA